MVDVAGGRIVVPLARVTGGSARPLWQQSATVTNRPVGSADQTRFIE